MNAPAKVVTLNLGEATITVPGELAAMAYLEKLLDESRPMPFHTPPARIVPAIGAQFEGGIYAGLTVVDNDPQELVLLPDSFKGTWAECAKWAEQQGGRLPSRIDQNVLFKNLKGEFEDAYYWSGEQCAGIDASAWYQYFGDGDQGYGLKDVTYRCRAVRSLSIR